MRRLGVQYLKPGMIIARTIHRASGGIVLGAGVELSEEYIERLPSQGITSVYIKDDLVSDLEIIDILSDSMRTIALGKAKKINESLESLFHKINDNGLKGKIVENTFEKVHDDLHALGKAIVEDFMRIKNPMITLIDTRVKEDYIYSHMVNVAAISILLGRALGYNFEKLVDLCKGCLVHDIGIIIGVPLEIRNKPGKLTDEEMNIVKEHPEVAYRFLKKMTEMNIMSSHVAYQHHERFNGGGYPRNLKKDEITEYGYVAGLSDVYDAITNNKSYKLRVLPEKAREFLMVARDRFFPAYIVDKFLEKIPAYPDCTSLILSTGDTAVVIKQNSENLSRPHVRIIERNGQRLAKGINKNLLNETSITIKKILD